jgi:hypothetical protein
MSPNGRTYTLDGLKRRMIDDPSENVTRHYETIIQMIEFVFFDRGTPGWGQRLESVVVKFPRGLVHARPFQFRQRCRRVS